MKDKWRLLPLFYDRASRFSKHDFGVIFQPLAFTAVADGQIWLEPNERAKEAVLDALNGCDYTGNAIYYLTLKQQQVNGFGHDHKLKQSDSIFSVHKKGDPMKKFIWVIIVFAAAVFLVYHFSVQSQNTRLENALANQYSNQLTSASEKLITLSDSIDQTLLFHDKEALDQPLEDVWKLLRRSNSISALPIDHETSTVWMNYLNRIGNGAS